MRVPQHLDPFVLSSFVAVVDTGSLRGAAAKVGRTEAAVSVQMAKLEALVGEPSLFRRDGRRKVLTERGEMFLAHARRLLSVERAVIDMVANTQRPRLVRLGVPDDYSALLPQIFRGFSIAQPSVEVELQCHPSGVLNEMVDAGSIEVAIITRALGQIQTDILRSEPLVWVSADGDLPLRREIIPLATFQHGCTTRRHCIEALAGAGRAYEVVLSSPSLTGVLQPVKSGIAVTAIPRCSISDDLSIVRNVHNLPTLPSLELLLTYNATRGLAPDAEALADVIRAELAVSN